MRIHPNKDITTLADNIDRPAKLFPFADEITPQVWEDSIGDVAEMDNIYLICTFAAKFLAMQLLFPGSIDDVIKKLQKTVREISEPSYEAALLPGLCINHLLDIDNNAVNPMWESVLSQNEFATQMLENSFILKVGLRLNLDNIYAAYADRIKTEIAELMTEDTFDGNCDKIFLYLQLTYPQMIEELGCQRVIEYVTSKVEQMRELGWWNQFWPLLLSLVLITNNITSLEVDGKLGIDLQPSPTEKTLVPQTLIL